MKKFLLGLFTVTTSYFHSNAMLTYELTMDTISTTKIERFPGYMVTSAQPYVNGGLVFTYPTNLFTTTPVISATVLAALHASNITYTVEVCLESSTSATIMVYKNNAGTITEAGNSEVTVHFIAIGI
jgi:hypothetical protein